jgi:uncharacterized protein
MDLLNHDIAHEFPQYLEKMHSLKTSDTHFAKLFHDKLGGAVISDEALEVMKKKRLNLKDQIYLRLLQP